jgi:glucosylglycerate synthase
LAGHAPGADDTVEQQSALSDALLRQLIAVGQVDILVGLPTLNNAATVVDVVRAVHVCFTRDFPRQRTVMINSDGGSTDGTPELIRSASFSEADTLLTSHSLRTLHRVVAPYHGLPGKHTALRTVFAAGELTQAKVLVVVDPSGPATSPARVTELISPVARSQVEFLAPCYRRDPRDGVLVTQLVRPLVRALYGVALDEPLGAEFSCSGRFASHCLERDIWDHEVARFAIDLWLRTEAVAERFALGQIWRPAPAVAGARTTLREAVQQVVLALIESLRVHPSFWKATNGIAPLPTWGNDLEETPDAQMWDYDALAGQARHDVGEIRPLLEEVLDPSLLARVVEETSSPELHSDDELWVKTVYAFAAAARRGQPGVEHLAGMFVPLYLWRAAAFMAHAAHEADGTVQEGLESLCQTFLRLKPLLVDSWSAEV